MGVAKNVKHLNWARIVTGAKMDALEAGQEIPAWAEAVSQCVCLCQCTCTAHDSRQACLT